MRFPVVADVIVGKAEAHRHVVAQVIKRPESQPAGAPVGALPAAWLVPIRAANSAHHRVAMLCRMGDGISGHGRGRAVTAECGSA